MAEMEKGSLQELAAEINAEHRAFVGTFRKTVEHGIRAGELLAQAKAECKHGTWLPWLEENFEGAIRTAQEYLRLYNHRDQLRAKTRDSAHLSMSGALREIATPTGSTPRETSDSEQPTLQDLERKAEAALAKTRQGCFEEAQILAEIHHGAEYLRHGYPNFAAYVKGRWRDRWLSQIVDDQIVDDLVDERGDPHDVFTMARILFEKT